MMTASRYTSILQQTTISIIIILIILTGQTDGIGVITIIGTGLITIIITVITMICGAIMITIGTDRTTDIMEVRTMRGNLRDTGPIFQQMASLQATINRTASNMSIQALIKTDLTASNQPVP
jgi:hypothetical protein